MEKIKFENFKLNKKVLAILGVVLISSLALFIGFGVRASSMALNYANLAKSDVSYIRFGFEIDDFLPEYEVKWNIGMREHEYKVHAFTGEILGYEID